MATAANLHWTSVSRIENARQNPTWDAVAGLAQALDVEIGELAQLAAKQPPRRKRR